MKRLPLRRWPTPYGFSKLLTLLPLAALTPLFQRVAEADGMLAERRDTVVVPFTGPQAHLFTRLETWAEEQRETLRAEIKTLVGL